MLGQSAACLSEDLYRDLRKSVQGLPETSVCVRDSDGNLNVYPPQDTIFKHAVGQLRFAAAIKVKLPTVRMLLQHTPPRSTISLGLGRFIPVLDTSVMLDAMSTGSTAAIIRDDQSLIMWSPSPPHKIVTECRELEHLLQHDVGFCSCSNSNSSFMGPTLCGPVTLEDDFDLTWDFNCSPSPDPHEQSPAPAAGSSFSALGSLAELPLLYGFSGGDSLYPISIPEPSWLSTPYDRGFPINPAWDAAATKDTPGDIDSEPEISSPPSFTFSYPAPGSPLSSSSASSSSSPPPTSSSSSSSAASTPMTVCLADISPQPATAPRLLDTDVYMSDSDDDDAEGESDHEDCDHDHERCSGSWSSPSPQSSPEISLSTLFAHTDERTGRKILPPRSPKPSPSTSQALPRTSRILAATPAPSEASSAASSSSSRKRKSPTPAPATRPTAGLRPVRSTRASAAAAAADFDAASPLSELSELSDGGSDYEADEEEADDDEEFTPVRRPAKRARVAEPAVEAVPPPRRRAAATRAVAAMASAADSSAADEDYVPAPAAPAHQRRAKGTSRGKGQKPGFCSSCGKTMSRQTDLRRHYMSSKCSMVPKKEKNEFFCDGRGAGGCGKAFNRDDAAKRHMRDQCCLVPPWVKADLRKEQKANQRSTKAEADAKLAERQRKASTVKNRGT